MAAIDFCCMGWMGMALVLVFWDLTTLVVFDAMIVMLSSSTSICVLFV